MQIEASFFGVLRGSFGGCCNVCHSRTNRLLRRMGKVETSRNFLPTQVYCQGFISCVPKYSSINFYRVWADGIDTNDIDTLGKVGIVQHAALNVSKTLPRKAE